jgi:hypothetical protein
VRLLLVASDPDAVHEMERVLLAAGEDGFTVVPNAWGSGRTGLHMGNRVHPGGTTVLFTVVPDARAELVMNLLREARDSVGAQEATHIYSLAAEEVT